MEEARNTHNFFKTSQKDSFSGDNIKMILGCEGVEVQVQEIILSSCVYVPVLSCEFFICNCNHKVNCFVAYAPVGHPCCVACDSTRVRHNTCKCC